MKTLISGKTPWEVYISLRGQRSVREHHEFKYLKRFQLFDLLSKTTLKIHHEFIGVAVCGKTACTVATRG